jgi:hypothetical protein
MIEHVFDDGATAVAGVALAVELRAPSEPAWVPAQPPQRIGEVLPVAARSDAELCDELRRVRSLESMLAAYKVELVLALAVQRPAEQDAPDAEPTWGVGGDKLPEPSEFVSDELAVVLRCSRAAATGLLEDANVLRLRLPTSWGRLADGLLDPERARALAAELGWAAVDVPDAVVHAVEAEVLPRAMTLSVRRLRELVRARLLAHGADTSEGRRARLERSANVRVEHGRDGMSTLTAFLPTASAAACADAVDRYARMLEADGDARPIGVLRARVLEDLVLRPWDTSRPPVTAHLTVTAPVTAAHSGSGEPIADLDGQPITAGLLRDLLAQLDAVCPGGLQAPAGGSLHVSLVDPVSGRLRAVVPRAQLASLARRGCPDHPTGGCACPVLDRPEAVDRYRPTAAQYRFVRTRDRTCRFPGCANRAAWADLDHVLPHAHGGPTACENLCCLCRRHHRLKTHARDWQFTLGEDGALTVTTPAGVAHTTWPPGLAPPDEPPPF